MFTNCLIYLFYLFLMELNLGLFFRVHLSPTTFLSGSLIGWHLRGSYDLLQQSWVTLQSFRWLLFWERNLARLGEFFVEVLLVNHIVLTLPHPRRHQHFRLNHLHYLPLLLHILLVLLQNFRIILIQDLQHSLRNLQSLHHLLLLQLDHPKKIHKSLMVLH